MASSNLHRDEGSSFVLFVWFVFVFSPWIVGVRLRPNESLSLPSLGLEAYVKLSPVSLTLESGYKIAWWIRAMCSVRKYRYRKWATSAIKRSNRRNSLTSVVGNDERQVCGSGKSLTIMLGGFPDTTTKTPKHEKLKRIETWIASMDNRNNRKAKESTLSPIPLYIRSFILRVSCPKVSRGTLTQP